MSAAGCFRYATAVVTTVTAVALGTSPVASDCGLEPAIRGDFTVSHPGSLDIAVAVADARRTGLLPQADPTAASNEVQLGTLLADLRRLQSRLKQATSRSVKALQHLLPDPGWTRPVVSYQPDIRWRPGPLPRRWTVGGRCGRTHPPGGPRGTVAGDLDHRRGNTTRSDGLRRQRCPFASQGIRDRYGSRGLSSEDLFEPG